MSLIKALIGVADSDTQISEAYMEEIYQVDTVDADSVVKKLAWSLNGHQRGLISGQTFVQAFSKLGRAGLLGADVKIGQGFQLADGRINGKFEMTLTNVGVTTPNVYGYSRSISRPENRIEVIASMRTINLNSHESFKKMQAVVFDPANLDNAVITFNRRYRNKAGQLGPKVKHSQKFVAAELPGLFNLGGNTSDADGKIATYTVIENFKGLLTPANNISEIELYAGAASLTVLVVRLV